MDFGMMTTFDEKPTTAINNHHGSGFTKQERSEPDPPSENDQQQLFLRTSKSSRTDYFDQPNNKSMPPIRSDSLLSVSVPDATVSNHMLSFSSSNSSSLSSTNAIKDGNQTSIFSFYQPSSPPYIRNTGYGCGGLEAGMQMGVSRYKGPFTPSQWMELEHQALIYKHFVANVPVPSHLLNPLRKSLNTFLFPGSSSSTSYAPNSYGWGNFHLGFSGNTDPEPGRCRRTDGKKWRCSRDAVPDQKYCERHINRGRHRSRKPVEGQNSGHAVSGPTNPKVGPLVSSSSVPVSATRASTTTALANNQFKTLNHHNAAIVSSKETNPINRIQESQAFAIPKLQNNPVEETSDSLMYPTNYSSFLDPPNPNPLHHFVDQQSGRTAWPEEPKPDWTQLSMSIPMASSDFSSSSNSPAQEKLAVAPLCLSNEFDLDLDHPTHKPASNWIPISWGNSMGGPLGEVLNRTSSSNGVIRSKNTSSLSSGGSEMWDHVNYHQVGSSPTGVLQKTTFVSLSNSSSGSSPKGNHGGGGLCDELLLSTLAS